MGPSHSRMGGRGQNGLCLFRQRRPCSRAVQCDAASRSGGNSPRTKVMNVKYRRLVGAAVTAAAFVSPAAPIACAQRPPSDSSFAGLVARLSEPNGYFDSDNIITNEVSYL